jgi:hypothetical protein
MREIERRTTVKRRVLLRGAAVAPAVAAAAATGFAPEAAWAQAAKNLSPQTMATLARAARDIFPHDHLADKYYIVAVSGYDTIAGGDAAKKAMLEEGVARLDADAKAKFQASNYISVSWEADRVTLLQGIAHTPFFAKLRGDLVVTLYNQKELWPKFGYEGSSAEHGGYINRGFADIDWLPTA